MSILVNFISLALKSIKFNKKYFCIAVSVGFCYLYQITFFSGWLVIHANRIKANRNTLLWCIKHDESVRKENNFEKKNHNKLHSIYEYFLTLWKKFYKFLLLNNYGKLFVGILFLIYISLSVWLSSKIKEGINPTGKYYN